MNLSVFGLGYVGSVSTACFASDGHFVVGVDANPDKVELVNEGRSPIVEPGLEAELQKAVGEGRLRATTDATDAVLSTSASLICVGTPSRKNGSLDLSYVESVAKQIGQAIALKATYHTVIVRSTTLPGTTHDLVVPTLERASGKRLGEGFGVVYNPEFLREGTAIKDFRTPAFTVIGAEHPTDAQAAASLYSKVDAPIVNTSIRVAEMVKYTSNAWHALKVSFANEIGSLCTELGADSREVMQIFCKDHRLNLSEYYLRPGFAFGGSCLPKDVRALQHRARELDANLPVLESILPSNRTHTERAIDAVCETGAKKVGILGISFKSGTDDLRESPAVVLAEALLGKGVELRIFDRNVLFARLVGTNREYIEGKIPHLSSLLSPSIERVIHESEVIVVANGAAEFAPALEMCGERQTIIDLVGLKIDRSKIRANYRGLCWT